MRTALAAALYIAACRPPSDTRGALPSPITPGGRDEDLARAEHVIAAFREQPIRLRSDDVLSALDSLRRSGRVDVYDRFGDPVAFERLTPGRYLVAMRQRRDRLPIRIVRNLCTLRPEWSLPELRSHLVAAAVADESTVAYQISTGGAILAERRIESADFDAIVSSTTLGEPARTQWLVRRGSRPTWAEIHLAAGALRVDSWTMDRTVLGAVAELPDAVAFETDESCPGATAVASLGAPQRSRCLTYSETQQRELLGDRRNDRIFVPGPNRQRRVLVGHPHRGPGQASGFHHGSIGDVAFVDGTVIAAAEFTPNDEPTASTGDVACGVALAGWPLTTSATRVAIACNVDYEGSTVGAVVHFYTLSQAQRRYDGALRLPPFQVIGSLFAPAALSSAPALSVLALTLSVVEGTTDGLRSRREWAMWLLREGAPPARIWVEPEPYDGLPSGACVLSEDDDDGLIVLARSRTGIEGETSSLEAFRMRLDRVPTLETAWRREFAAPVLLVSGIPSRH